MTGPFFMHPTTAVGATARESVNYSRSVSYLARAMVCWAMVCWAVGCRAQG